MFWLIINNYFLKLNYNSVRFTKFIKHSQTIKINNFTYNNMFSFDLVKNDNNFLFMLKFNKLYVYSFNRLNSILVNKFFKNINYIFYNNSKILFLDNEINFLLPFYNYIFGYKDLVNYKTFFFVNKNYFTKNNWIYYYKNFIKTKNICALIILDYNFFKKFINVFSKLNIPLFSFFNPYNINVNIDFFFYISNINYNFLKFIVFNNIVILFFKNFRINVFVIRQKYLKKLDSIILK